MHVMCHMRRRIHACHVSHEEEDTCMSVFDDTHHQTHMTANWGH